MGGADQLSVIMFFIPILSPISAAGAMASKSCASSLLEGDLPRSTMGPDISEAAFEDSAVIRTMYLFKDASPSVCSPFVIVPNFSIG